MSEIIKEIRKIIGTDYCADLKVSFYGDEIVFCIYETEIPIVFNKKESIYIDSEINKVNLDTECIEKLAQIMRFLEDNKETLKEYLFEWEDVEK